MTPVFHVRRGLEKCTSKFHACESATDETYQILHGKTSKIHFSFHSGRERTVTSEIDQHLQNNSLCHTSHPPLRLVLAGVSISTFSEPVFTLIYSCPSPLDLFSPFNHLSLEVFIITKHFCFLLPRTDFCVLAGLLLLGSSPALSSIQKNYMSD